MPVLKPVAVTVMFLCIYSWNNNNLLSLRYILGPNQVRCFVKDPYAVFGDTPRVLKLSCLFTVLYRKIRGSQRFRKAIRRNPSP
jgi:hypothetical protein